MKSTQELKSEIEALQKQLDEARERDREEAVERASQEQRRVTPYAHLTQSASFRRKGSVGGCIVKFGVVKNRGTQRRNSAGQ